MYARCQQVDFGTLLLNRNLPLGIYKIIIRQLYCTVRLKKSGIGCHRMSYMGILGYADDVTLLSPSIRGLNRMLSICEEFGKEYFIKFDSKKSMCIKYGEKYDCEKAQLNEETIILVDSVKLKYLGNIINNDLNDIDNCKMKCSSFISSCNKLHCNYANVQPCILSKLFKCFCTVYGIFLQKVLEKLLHCGI